VGVERCRPFIQPIPTIPHKPDFFTPTQTLSLRENSSIPVFQSSEFGVWSVDVAHDIG
jgi:hypothetical protein